MRPVLHTCLAFFAIAIAGPSFALQSQPTDDNARLGGQVVARIAGKQINFPSLKTEIKGELRGDLASITVRQTFVNPTQRPMNAKYLFPLNKDAAVHAMQMRIGDELVTAQIEKKAEARKTYETAKRTGKAAALLEQHRPNMFTQEIANLMPGAPVVITITYSQAVPRVDGAYELRVPLVVGPRYIPNPNMRAPKTVSLEGRNPESYQRKETQFGNWQFGPVPNYPAVAGLNIPGTVLKERVSLNFDLKSAIPVTSVNSQTHKLTVSGDKRRKSVSLASGKTIDNRDFVLRYALAGAQPQAGFLAHREKDQSTFSLMIEPPKVAPESNVTPREMVFVLDTSGSMSGAPMEASKAFMRHALKNLRAQDYFRIIRFSSNSSEFSPGAIAAKPANLRAGIAYVNQLSAGGGTQILGGLQRAYAAPSKRNVLRIVVFLSDGYVGNEAEILRTVSQSAGQGRLYAFGVGTSVNRYLIAEMARQGRGLSRIMDPTISGQEQAITFASRLETPVLTDLNINWGGLKPTGVTPSPLPDLFAGDSIRVQGRSTATGPQTITISGKVNGRAVKLPLRLNLDTAETGDSEAIPFIWARSRVADQMRELMVPQPLRSTGLTDDEIEANVTKLGLEHSLVTQRTSFVAVSDKIVNETPGASVDADVPLPMVKGVTHKAYPNGQQPQTRKARSAPRKKAKYTQLAMQTTKSAPLSRAPSFSGGATPEPQHIFALLVLIFSVGGTLVHQMRRRVA